MLNNRIKSVIFILVFALLLGLFVYSIVSKSKSPQVRAEGMIDFTLSSLNGKQYSISDFRGKKVVLNFFATWCPPCRAEIPDFERFYQSKKDSIVTIGIDIQEDKVAVKEFANSIGITYPVLLDSDGKIASSFGIEGIPTTFLLDENGKLIKKNVGMMSYSELEKFATQK